MNISRRSFLKMAGLTVVAAAGASMFTGCGAFSTTPIKVVAAKDSTKEWWRKHQGVPGCCCRAEQKEAGRMAC